MGLAAFNKMRKLRVKKERLEAENAKETEKKELISKLEKEQREKALVLALALKEKDAQLESKDEMDLESLKVEKLKELAKEKGIEGYDKMKKAGLLEALKG